MKLSGETRDRLIEQLVAEREAEKGDGRAVLVTTEHRGVFFGYATDTDCDPITLTRARNCIYWHKSVGGFAGLATTGPNSQCRIGAEVSQIALCGITSVSEASEAAAKAWGEASCVS